MGDPTAYMAPELFVRFRNIGRISDANGEQWQHIQCACGHRSIVQVERWREKQRHFCAHCGLCRAHSSSFAAKRLREQEASNE